MARLVLHVGTHKTGTTSIQDALALSRGSLKKDGIYYPDISPYFGGRRDAHHELAHCLARDDEASEARVQRFVLHLEKAAQHYDTIVLSAEPFYRHSFHSALVPKPQEDPEIPQQRQSRDAYVARLASVFSGFNSEISIFFRHPLEFAESLFANAVVNSASKADFAEYVSQRSLRFDYRFQLDTFRRHFSRVNVFSYEEKAKGDLVASFFRDHGLGAPTVASARLRTGATKPAVTWLLRAKQTNEMKIREIRERYHFSLLDGSRQLFSEPARSTFWISPREREHFFRLYADHFGEIDFAPPGEMPPAVAWDDARQHAAESAFLAWSRENREYLNARHRLSLPAYVIDENVRVTKSTEREIVAATRAHKPLTAAICTATRNRETMLKDLLASFERLIVPGDVTPVFVIVENKDRETMSGVVDGFRKRMTEATVDYALEPDIGIPMARNTAVERALLAGADVILFVDDDEFVAEDWLERMIQRYRATDLMLIGGPVLPVVPGTAGSLWRNGIARGIEDRYRAKMEKAGARLRAGQQNKIVVITNNWLGDSQLFTKYRLLFDPAMRFSGGSDARFFHDVANRGLATGWCPDAFVFETVPPDRISIAYQFHRAMAQSRTSLGSAIRKSGFTLSLLSFAAIFMVRICGMIFLALLLPFLGSRIAVRLARSAGWIAGRITGFFGVKSSLYARTTGF